MSVSSTVSFMPPGMVKGMLFGSVSFSPKVRTAVAMPFSLVVMLFSGFASSLYTT